MLIEISDPSAMDALREHLQRNGCPSERRSEDTFEVVVLWLADAPLTDAQVRMKVFGHLREWCAGNLGIKTNVLA